MTDPQTPDTPPTKSAKTPGNGGLLPGIAFICIWMLLLCAIGLIGVITHNLPPAVMLLCAAYAIGANGLLKLRRWGWALTLGAAFLSMCYGVYVLFHFHQLPIIVMAAVNLVIFLYLVRPEVVERMK